MNDPLTLGEVISKLEELRSKHGDHISVYVRAMEVPSVITNSHDAFPVLSIDRASISVYLSESVQANPINIIEIIV